MKKGTRRALRVSYGVAMALLLVIILTPTDLRAEGEDRSAEPGCKLVMELRNGSRFVGTPKEPMLSLKTEFAVLNIPMNRVTEITQKMDDGRSLITLINGDAMSGHLSRESFRMTTAIGAVVIPLSLIKKGRTLSKGESVGASRWSKAVGGLTCRLSSTANTVKDRGCLRLLLEIKNISKKSLEFPYPIIDTRIEGSARQQRNRLQGGYVIQLRSRTIKQENVEVEEQLIVCGMMMERLAIQDIALKPDDVITIKLRVKTMVSEMPSMLEDFEIFEHARPVVIRERLNWSLNGLGTYGLEAIIKRPHSEKVRIGKDAILTTWNGPLISPELVVEVTK